MLASENVERLRAQLAAANAALDRLCIGIIAVDATGRIVLANRMATAMVGEHDGLVVLRGRLRASSRRAAGRLDAAIRRVCEGAAGVGGIALVIPRPSQRPPLHVIVQHSSEPAWSNARGAANSRQGLAVLLVTDTEHVAAPHPEWLVHLFGLTGAEARLAAALATRHTLASYAKQSGITVGTARWTLRRVLEKVGCRRQSELVHLLATNIAALLLD